MDEQTGRRTDGRTEPCMAEYRFEFENKFVSDFPKKEEEGPKAKKESSMEELVREKSSEEEEEDEDDK